MLLCLIYVLFIINNNVTSFSFNKNRNININRNTLKMSVIDKPKKVIVLGGDGFCGWPTSLYLSDKGHEIIIVDNLSRRKIDVELGCDSLTPISEISSRINIRKPIQKSSAPQTHTPIKNALTYSLRNAECQ